MKRHPAMPRSLAACLAGVQGRGHPLAAAPLLVPSVRRRRRLLPDAATPPPPAEPAPGRHVRSDELARLEAALFLAREPLATRRLAKLAGLSDGTRARTLIRELRGLQEAAGSPVRVEQIAGGFQLLTRAPFGPWIRRLLEPAPTGRLSLSALETLAIVAYRQPVTKAEVEAIRGVGSDEMLRQLLDRDYVAIGGRAEDLGRPNVYITTRRFLAAFGLASLQDLPPIDPLPGAAPEEPAGSPDGTPSPGPDG
jgi:segregation and condensation protein B